MAIFYYMVDILKYLSLCYWIFSKLIIFVCIYQALVQRLQMVVHFV